MGVSGLQAPPELKNPYNKIPITDTQPMITEQTIVSSAQLDTLTLVERFADELDRINPEEYRRILSGLGDHIEHMGGHANMGLLRSNLLAIKRTNRDDPRDPLGHILETLQHALGQQAGEDFYFGEHHSGSATYGFFKLQDRE